MLARRAPADLTQVVEDAMVWGPWLLLLAMTLLAAVTT